MVSELVLTFILSLSNNSFSNNNYEDYIGNFSIVSSATNNHYVLENGNYLSILQPLENDQEDSPSNNRSSTVGYASIDNKFIKVGNDRYFDNYSYMRVGQQNLVLEISFTTRALMLRKQIAIFGAMASIIAQHYILLTHIIKGVFYE